MNERDVTRRSFMRAGSALAAGVMAVPVGRVFGQNETAAGQVSAAGRALEPLRVGVIGCGGRGTGAAVNALEADPATRIVALGDVFRDRLEGCLRELKGMAEFAARVDVAPERCHTGFDAFKQVIDSDVDVVLLCTPPHFRPMHFEAAVQAGKHVFMEKPVAVCPAGVRTVLEAARMADGKRLSVVAGTQRRHETCYLEAMKRIQDGAIGEIISARANWLQGGLWVHERRAEETDMEYQLRNWLYFDWTSGDHICEQHVHNLDVVNWAIGTHPVSCTGMGGRQVRTGEQYGNVFDHFAIEYVYPNGQTMISMCRQIDGCCWRVEEMLVGTKGRCYLTSGSARIEGAVNWKFEGQNNNPYVEEHRVLYEAIRSGSSVNEAVAVAEATMTAIMGRLSAYTGQQVTCEQVLTSKLDLSPRAYAFGPLDVRPVPVPGKTAMV